MDRNIPKEQLNKIRTKTIVLVVLITLLLVVAFLTLNTFVDPSVKGSSFSTSIAEIGTIEATVPASGVVVPEYEVLLTSPVNAKIEKVLHTAGEPVNSGQPILQLNKESSLIAFEKLNEEQQVNRNKITQLQLSLKKSLNDLRTQYDIKQIRIRSLETALAHEQSLLTIGGSTEENVKQGRLNLNVAQLELKQLQNQIDDQKAIMQADLKSLGYEISIRGKDIGEIGSKLKQADICSPRNGVITWINDKIGAEISEGAELVRIADLSSFKVDASISESYADEVKSGRTAIIRIDNTDLRGKVVNVQPAVENGIVKFSISLDNKSSGLLRPNLKAEVYVITSVRERVLRVSNGAAFSGSELQKIFVLENGRAVLHQVKIGAGNSDYVEILSGVKPGERIITSDMQDYIHLSSVRIN